MVQSIKGPPPHWLRTTLVAAGIWVGIGSHAAQAGSQRKVLVLSAAEDGRQNEGLRVALGELVERTGALLISPAGLPLATRAGNEPSCLSALSKEHQVDLILAARLERHGKHERLVDVWAFEEGSSRDTSERDLCDARDLKDCVSDLGARVLSKLMSEPSPAESAQGVGTPLSSSRSGSLSPTAAGAHAQVPRGLPTPMPTWRVGLGASLTALSAICLGVGIGASIKHGSNGLGKCAMGTEAECRYNLSPLFGPAYVVAGVSAVVAALTLAWPTPRVSKKESAR